MILSITKLELKSAKHLFFVVKAANQILNELDKDPNCIKAKTKGFWKKHYTMTLWKDQKSLNDFLKKSAHKNISKESSKVAKEIITLHLKSEETLGWKKALQLLKEKGHSRKYR